MEPITKPTKFTGGLTYNETKQLHRQIDPNLPDYAGFPTTEIDLAWKKLISSEYYGRELRCLEIY